MLPWTCISTSKHDKDAEWPPILRATNMLGATGPLERSKLSRAGRAQAVKRLMRLKAKLVATGVLGKIFRRIGRDGPLTYVSGPHLCRDLAPHFSRPVA